MGITGLIPFLLDKASSQIQISKFRGQTVAIDTYCWLHKGAFACADKLARGEETDIHIQYCLKYVNLLLSHDIKPILVFDGRHLPAKELTEKKRREARDIAKKRGAELLRMGRVDEARTYLRRCVDITHEMALKLIQECRKRNVDCIVAPFEADAQLAYLNRKNIAQCVITEDSDLVLFGCNRIIFKLDLTGQCLLVEADRLHKAMGCKEENYSFDKFRFMCILSGCDYLDSLPGIGLAKACKFFLMTEEMNVRKSLPKIPSYLNMKNLTVPSDYIENFLRADATFKHMIVFDPTLRKSVRLNEIEDLGTDIELCSNAGTFLDEEISFQLALGNVDPFTFKILDKWHPDQHQISSNQKKIAKHPSIWQKHIEFHETEVPDTSQKSLMNKIQQLEHNFLMSQKDNEPETMDEILDCYNTNSKRQHNDSPAEEMLSSSQKENDDSECDKTPKRRRTGEGNKRVNPFAVKSPETDILSPTKITGANSSFLKNISPVRRIGSAHLEKRTKLSKFDTTLAVDTNKKVVSRFFAQSIKTENHQKSMETINQSPPQKMENIDCTILKYEPRIQSATEIYLSSPESHIKDRGEKTPVKSRPSLSALFSFKSETSRTNLFAEPPAVKDEIETNMNSIDLKIEDSLNKIKQEDDIIIISPEKNELDCVQTKSNSINDESKIAKDKNSNNLGSDVKRQSLKKITTKVRTIGLSKKGNAQCNLMMFGFQKKSSLKK